MDTFAGMRVDRLCCMLCHLRRYASSRDKDGRLLQLAAKKCTAEQLQQLKDLISMLQLDEGPDDEGGCISEQETVWLDPAAPATPMSRILKREVSLDADGYPHMLSSHGSPVHRRITTKSPPAASSPGAPGVLSAALLGYEDSKAKEVADAPSSAKAKASTKSAGSAAAPFDPKAKAKLDPKAKTKVNPKAKTKSAAVSPGSVNAHKRSMMDAAQSKAELEASASNTKLDFVWMFYKNSNSIGIRIKGGQQIFSFGIGAKSFLTDAKYQALVHLAKEVLCKLLEKVEWYLVHQAALFQAGDIKNM